MYKHVFIDFETRSACDLKACGADVYARHPSTEVLCLAYAFDDGPVKLWRPFDDDPEELWLHVVSDRPVVGHNVGGFEILIWNEICSSQFNFPLLQPSQLIDTMAMAYAMALPGSLEKAAAAAGIQNQKDTVGHRLMLQLSQPRDVTPDGKIIWWSDQGKLERLYAYCKQDVEVERELFKRLMPLSNSEKALWVLDHRINQRGIQVDLPAIHAALQIVECERQRLDEKMREETDNQVAGTQATAQLTAWIRTQGVETDGVAKADIVDLLSEPSLPDRVRRALLIRQEAAKSSTAKLQAMLNRAGSDGRLRGSTQYHGASTGRWAGRGVQVHNFPRPTHGQSEIDEVMSILGRAGHGLSNL